MNNVYYELWLKPSFGSDYFTDLIFSLDFDAIEESDGFLIVRSEECLDDLEYGFYNFAEKLGKKLGKNIDLQIKRFKKENKDWLESYKKSVKPVEIDKIYIRPQWELPKENRLNIIINPALAFGSGHHESTYGCVKILLKYLRKDMKVLDVGSGSGVLGIVSSKLGAKVDFCDTDEIAIKSSLENFKLNNAKYENFWLGSANQTKDKYDLVVGNLITDIILAIAKDLKARLTKEGFLVLSGILKKDEERIKKHFSDFVIMEIYDKNEWCSFVFKGK